MMTTDDSTKVLRVGFLTGQPNLNPRQAQDIDSLFVLRQIVEAPFASKPGEAELEPILFTGGLERDPSDARTCRARVRDGIRFSDGKPLTAADVADCLSRTALVEEHAAAIEARGDEVVFFLRRPNPSFDVTLSHPQCSIYRRVGADLVGTGAYRLAESGSQDSMRLVRNPHHRVEAPIGEVRFQVYPLDDDGVPTALLRAIESGEVDFTSSLSRDDVNALTGVRKSILPGISTSALYLNTKSPRLADRRLRQAIARSIDRVEVARTAFSNALAFAAPSILPRVLGSADDELSYDPGVASELVQASGIQVPDRLTLLMMWGPRPYLPKPQRYFEVIAKNLGRIGIEVVPVPTASGQEFIEKSIVGEEDLILSGWVADVMDPADFLEANLASFRVPTAENISVSSNCGRLASPVMDLALAAYRSERTADRLDDVMRVLSDEAPLVPLTYGPTTAVWSFQVKGFTPSPLSILPLSQLDLAPDPLEPSSFSPAAGLSVASWLTQ